MVDEEPHDLEEDKEGASFPTSNPKNNAEKVFRDKLKASLADGPVVPEFKGGIQQKQ